MQRAQVSTSLPLFGLRSRKLPCKGPLRLIFSSSLVTFYYFASNARILFSQIKSHFLLGQLSFGKLVVHKNIYVAHVNTVIESCGS